MQSRTLTCRKPKGYKSVGLYDVRAHHVLPPSRGGARGAELEPDAGAVEALLADPAAFEWVGVTELYDESW